MAARNRNPRIHHQNPRPYRRTASASPQLTINPRRGRRPVDRLGRRRTRDIQAMSCGQLGVLANPHVSSGSSGDVGECHGYQFSQMKLPSVTLRAELEYDFGGCRQSLCVLREQGQGKEKKYTARQAEFPHSRWPNLCQSNSAWRLFDSDHLQEALIWVKYIRLSHIRLSLSRYNNKLGDARYFTMLTGRDEDSCSKLP
jgi:hypothetical protein